MEERDKNFIPNLSFGKPGGAIGHEDFEIGGIFIRAFYDASHRLLFILDRTQDDILPNILLVLNAHGNRKWDDILSNDFGVDPESVRPRDANKYQKLDIDYTALDYYNDSITTGSADALHPIRREIAARQKENRIGDAFRELNLARSTIMETDKAIAELEDFIHLQKAKLKDAREKIGKEPPKDSAAKILRFEARIERASLKKERAERRLHRAKSRIDRAEALIHNYKDIALPDGDFLKKDDSRADMLEDEMNENDVKPIVSQDPNIVDSTNAFKPVNFNQGVGIDAPPPVSPITPLPPPSFTAAPTMPNQPIPAMPLPSRPISPITGNIAVQSDTKHRGGGAYYFMLIILIGLSIYTLYLYQERMNTDSAPHIAATRKQVDNVADIPNVVHEEPEQLPQFVEPVALGPEPIGPEMLEEFHRNNPDNSGDSHRNFVTENDPNFQPILPATLDDPEFIQTDTLTDVGDAYYDEGEHHYFDTEQVWDEEIHSDEWDGGEVPILEESVLELHQADGEFEVDEHNEWHDDSWGR